MNKVLYYTQEKEEYDIFLNISLKLSALETTRGCDICHCRVSRNQGFDVISMQMHTCVTVGYSTKCKHYDAAFSEDDSLK